MDDVRIGLIGAGRIGSSHARLWPNGCRARDS